MRKDLLINLVNSPLLLKKKIYKSIIIIGKWENKESLDITAVCKTKRIAQLYMKKLKRNDNFSGIIGFRVYINVFSTSAQSEIISYSKSNNYCTECLKKICGCNIDNTNPDHPRIYKNIFHCGDCISFSTFYCTCNRNFKIIY